MKLPLALAFAPTDLRGPGGVRALRAAQDEALWLAAERAGAPTPVDFPRDADGAPRPFGAGSWRWSAANTRGAALAAVAPVRVGVDLEALDRPRVAPAKEFADAGELALCESWDREHTLALWTAKEAVLKMVGCGIAELRACRLAAPLSLASGEVTLAHRGERRRVSLVQSSGFLLAAAFEEAQLSPELFVARKAQAEAHA
ncbi:MAG: 4'-phosphopantetheinyl transferase superfamily protein [Planctomycetota bacterium]